MSRKRNTTQLENEIAYFNTFNKFKQIAISRFKWDNLPLGIEEKHIEEFLFNWGIAIFFKDPLMSYMCLKADKGSYLNVYGEPLNWWATGFNYHKNYNADECVIIDNNKLRLPTRDYIHHYALKIAEAERTADVNVRACKTPMIFSGADEKTILSFKTAFNKIDGNVPVIFLDRTFTPDSIKSLDTGAKFIASDVTEYKHTLENELLTFLGVNNNPIQKKERVITDEANANNDLISNFAEVQLSCRKKAVEEINNMYGLNIKVSMRVDGEEKNNDDTENVFTV